MRQLDNVKKDELAKKLEAKEHECLEYRARLDRVPQISIQMETVTPVEVLEKEVEDRMKDMRDQMEACRVRIEGIFQEMGMLKTTVREKIVVPTLVDYSDAVIDEQSQVIGASYQAQVDEAPSERQVENDSANEELVVPEAS